MGEVQAWAIDAADEHAATIFGEIAVDYDVGKLADVDTLPCEEVVIEWNATPTWQPAS